MNIWDIAILQPILNVLIVLSNYIFNSFGLSIIILTIIIRLILFPLSISQLKSTKAMSGLQPKLLELQKKYAKDRGKLASEQMRLYKESGISPVGCMVPMLIQMPIWIALYQSIILALAVTPEGLLNLARYVYPWDVAFAALPLENRFLWLDMATGDTILAILVGISMWVQQKMVTPTSSDPRQQAQARMMLWMMPMMFTFFSLSFPSGLALYWVVSNIISIVMQYYVTGWGGLTLSRAPTGTAVPKDRYSRRIALEEAQRPKVTPAAPAESQPKNEPADQPEQKKDTRWKIWK